MRRLLITLLLISVVLAAIAPQTQVIGDENENNETTTLTTSEATSQTTNQASSTSTQSGRFILKVDPPVHTVHLNKKDKNATYAIRVIAYQGFTEEVELSLEIDPKPMDMKVAFIPDDEGVPNPVGVPSPVFKSLLRVDVGLTTLPGQYRLFVTAGDEDGKEFFAQQEVLLIVEGTASTVTKHAQNGLEVSVRTQEENYENVPGTAVYIFGRVRLGHGESAPGANVSIEVLDPTTAQVYADSITADRMGRYSGNFSLAKNAANGTYTVYVTASLSPYKDSSGSVTFTVGPSDIPSIRIAEINITKVDGATPTEFQAGDTVLLTVTVHNGGADLQNAMIWVEVMDPDSVPISVVVVMVTIHHGEEVKTGLQIVLQTDSSSGIYTVKTFVSDGPIMKGGKFLDSDKAAFIVVNQSA